MPETYIKFHLYHKTNRTKSSKGLQYKLMHLMEIDNSTNRPQEPAIGRYHKRDESTSHHHNGHFLCI